MKIKGLNNNAKNYSLSLTLCSLGCFTFNWVCELFEGRKLLQGVVNLQILSYLFDNMAAVLTTSKGGKHPLTLVPPKLRKELSRLRTIVHNSNFNHQTNIKLTFNQNTKNFKNQK